MAAAQEMEAEIRHPGITCDNCEKSITGVRYKCATCRDYDLCEACERQRLHAYHEMIRICQPRPRGIQPSMAQRRARRPLPKQRRGPSSIPSNTGVLHPGITCDNCQADIHGFRYKCTTCVDYDLCPTCERRGVHSEHGMLRIAHPHQIMIHPQFASLTTHTGITEDQTSPSSTPPNKGVLHPGIHCDNCQGEIRGIRYKCVTCLDYDLCTTCEREGAHTVHEMLRVARPRRNIIFGIAGANITGIPQPDKGSADVVHVRNGGVLHPNVTCDVCDGAIYGVRYKCTVCRDYDICASCEVKDVHTEHEMTRIATPRTLQQNLQGTRGEEIQTSVAQKQVHPNVRCDNCQSSIVGARYKCIKCPNYDLCTACEMKSIHPQNHDLLKIRQPRARNQQGTRWVRKKITAPCTGTDGPVAVIPETCGINFKVGSKVKCTAWITRYGVVRWIGSFKDNYIVGIEKEEADGNDGALLGHRLFRCPPGMGMHAGLAACTPDDRNLDVTDVKPTPAKTVNVGGVEMENFVVDLCDQLRPILKVGAFGRRENLFAASLRQNPPQAAAQRTSEDKLPVAATPSELNTELNIDSMVEVYGGQNRRYGVVRWLGKCSSVPMAGLEMEEPMKIGPNSTLEGHHMFESPADRCLYVRLDLCKPDSRFQAPDDTANAQSTDEGDDEWATELDWDDTNFSDDDDEEERRERPVAMNVWQLDTDFRVGSMVEVKGRPREYGVIRWIGRWRDTPTAGIELEEPSLDANSGELGGQKLFDCETNTGCFVPLSSCIADSRFT